MNFGEKEGINIEAIRFIQFTTKAKFNHKKSQYRLAF